MSTPILQSNQSSAVVATVNESTTKNPWVYNEKDRLTVPHSLQVLPIAPSAGSTAADSTVTFEVAKNGIAMGFWLKLKLDGSVTFADFGALDLIDEITLNTSGRVVERLDKFQIMARYRATPLTRQYVLAEELHMDGGVFEGQGLEDPNANAQTISGTMYVWMPFYMLRDPHRYGIMTNFEEPHHIDVKFSNDSSMSNVSATATELLVHYRQLDEAHINELVSKNYGDGMLSRLVGISKREPVYNETATNNTASTAKIELTENEAVRSMYIMVEGNNTLAKIENVKLTFNNTDVIDCDARFISAFACNWDMMHSGNEEHLNTSGKAHIMKHIMRLDLGHGSDADLGNIIAFRELSNPTLEVTYVGNSSSEHHVHVIYETATFLTASAATGRVQLSLSS